MNNKRLDSNAGSLWLRNCRAIATDAPRRVKAATQEGHPATGWRRSSTRRELIVKWRIPKARRLPHGSIFKGFRLVGLATFELGHLGLGPEVVLVARLGLDEDHELHGLMTKGGWSFSGSG